VRTVVLSRRPESHAFHSSFSAACRWPHCGFWRMTMCSRRTRRRADDERTPRALFLVRCELYAVRCAYFQVFSPTPPYCPVDPPLHCRRATALLYCTAHRKQLTFAAAARLLKKGNDARGRFSERPARGRFSDTRDVSQSPRYPKAQYHADCTHGPSACAALAQGGLHCLLPRAAAPHAAVSLVWISVDVLFPERRVTITAVTPVSGQFACIMVSTVKF
jgi:hypothetical protein